MPFPEQIVFNWSVSYQIALAEYHRHNSVCDIWHEIQDSEKAIWYSVNYTWLTLACLYRMNPNFL